MSKKESKRAEVKRGILNIGSGTTFPVVITKNGVIKIAVGK